MLGSGIHQIEIVFLLLLLFVVVFGLLARRLQIPYPIVMVIGGLFLSFVPGIPKITLNSDLVFFVILPPLLYSAAWTTSWYLPIPAPPKIPWFYFFFAHIYHSGVYVPYKNNCRFVLPSTDYHHRCCADE